MSRGACPSLSAPMQTGDGLLARLNPLEGRLTGRQLAGLARAAEACGNGLLEITMRGSLQVRGLTAESAVRLRAEVAALDIAWHPGVPVATGPLAGLDASEIADPRPLAEEIRARSDALGLPARLGPKVSVTVDGGGALGLALVADVALAAVPGAEALRWRLTVGDRVLGDHATADAVAMAIRMLAAVADRGRLARSRDLPDAVLTDVAGAAPTPATELPATRPPVGRFLLAGGAWGRGFALAFGQIGSRALAAFAQAAGEAREMRLAPGRGLIVLHLAEDEEAALVASAMDLGLVSNADDPRLAVSACAGKPACASAHLPTKSLAERLVAARPDLIDGAFRLHISGCEKQCGRPAGPSVVLRGRPGGHLIGAEGCALPDELGRVLARLAGTLP
jgi:precorrin-3B synthase